MEDVNIINGPFSAEYGDFSGLGVVHIRTARNTAGSVYGAHAGRHLSAASRGFFSFSPEREHVDAYLAYEGSYTDGPFHSPGRYTRAQYQRQLHAQPGRRASSFGFKYNVGLERFLLLRPDSARSGRAGRWTASDTSTRPTAAVCAAARQRPTTGKRIHNGDVLKVDGFVTRSLFDLVLQLHVLPERSGARRRLPAARFAPASKAPTRSISAPTRLPALAGAAHRAAPTFTTTRSTSASTRGKDACLLGVNTRDHAQVTNGAAYAQESVTPAGRPDVARRRRALRRIPLRCADGESGSSGIAVGRRWQPQSATRFHARRTALPLTLYANYGRGISTTDARGVVQHPDQPAVPTTDFYQFGSVVSLRAAFGQPRTASGSTTRTSRSTSPTTARSSSKARAARTDSRPRPPWRSRGTSRSTAA